MAHFSGLVAAGLQRQSLRICRHRHVHHSQDLRGPRAGIIFAKEEEVRAGVDKTVFPALQGGPLVHEESQPRQSVFLVAMKPEFVTYQRQVTSNAQALAAGMSANGYRVVSGGTDTHVLLVDVFLKAFAVSGAEQSLDRARITATRTPSGSTPIRR